MTGQMEAIRELIEPWLAAEDVELDDLELAGSERAQIVRILVDAEGGVDIDRIADLSLGISALLDAETDLPGPYQLEVSSPGLERKLKTPRHFQKSVGRDVTIKVRRDDETTVLKGVLSGADDSRFTVSVEDETTTARYEEVVTAKTVFRWQAAPKPGKK
ncbi:MAG: ribosome maturation factor RimP [Acidimicrobiia bacterium]|nr:ribosome maturation factor RimP [Acidimicrobiia bacterium]MDH5292752.1 ribosome maturation factor RimP [Acidimicrobiia bacterium]